MRPTFSIILFTVLSGAGYGLWFLLGVGLAAHWPNHFADDAASGFAWANLGDSALMVGFVLVSAGLVASVGHLGRPVRAWRAFSQWRSSWLSREGVASIITYLPAAALIALSVASRFAISEPATLQRLLGWQRPLGALLAIGAVTTVVCTANIYSSLKPIRAWHNRYVVPVYLLLGFYTGTLWMIALASLTLRPMPAASPVQMFLVLALALIVAVFKWRYWRWLDAQPRAPDAGIATGLARFGHVRSFEQPHTEENYLTHEMGFILARKHSRKLRLIALSMIVCAALALIALNFVIGAYVAWIALAFGMIGVFVERWLFFAEARHAVIAFYGR